MHRMHLQSNHFVNLSVWLHLSKVAREKDFYLKDARIFAFIPENMNPCLMCTLLYDESGWEVCYPELPLWIRWSQSMICHDMSWYRYHDKLHILNPFWWVKNNTKPVKGIIKLSQKPRKSAVWVFICIIFEITYFVMKCHQISYVMKCHHISPHIMKCQLFQG